MALTQAELARKAVRDKANVSQFGTADKDKIAEISKKRQATGFNEEAGVEFAQAGGTPQTPPKTASNGFGTGSVAGFQLNQFNQSQNQPSQADIRKEATERFQGEIDTVDDLFNSMIFDARERGAARTKESLGQTRSVNAARGLLGSARGFATRNRVSDIEGARTEGEVGLIRAQQAKQKATIMSAIRAFSDNREDAANAARTAGQAEYQKFLTEQKENDFNNANAVVAGLLQQGLTFDNLELNDVDEIARGLGVTVPQLESIYRGKFAEQEAGTDAAINDILATAINAGADIATQQAIVDSPDERSALLAAGTFAKVREQKQRKADLDLLKLSQDIQSTDLRDAIAEGNFTLALEKFAMDTQKFNNDVEQQNFERGIKQQELEASGGLNKDQTRRVDSMSSEFNKTQIVKDFNAVQNKLLSVQMIVENGAAGPNDLALVFEFMKALDPSSVVRESEYATAAASGPLFDGVYKKFEGLFTEGQFLTEEVKNQFLEIIRDKKTIADAQYLNLRADTAQTLDEVSGIAGYGFERLTDFEAAQNFVGVPTAAQNDEADSLLDSIQ